MSLGTVLERYPDKVIHDATDPVSGLQSHCKFPPSVAEAAQFCDELKRRATYAGDWDKRSAEQLRERETIRHEQEQETPEHRKHVAERIMDELRARKFRFIGDEHRDGDVEF